MTPMEQVPIIDAKLKAIDLQIQEHIAAKYKLEDQLRQIHQSLDYRERCLRELGKERSMIATFELSL
jgi:hypothetical protein